MLLKRIPEEIFLNTIACPRFNSLNYSPYKLDRSQAIALLSLKYFYKNIDLLYSSLDIDNIINMSVRKAIGQKLISELEAYRKSIKLYCYNFIYNFIKKYPLESWTPVLLDVNLPYEYGGRTVLLKYDFILKSVETNKFLVISFVHKLDKQIRTSLDYFKAKANLLRERMYLPLNKPEIAFFLFYFPKHKHSNIKQRNDFVFIPVVADNQEISTYITIYLNKVKLQRNPFCLNYACPVRKHCYEN